MRHIVIIVLCLVGLVAATPTIASVAPQGRTYTVTELRDFWQRIDRKESIADVQREISEDWGGFPVAFKGPNQNGVFTEVQILGVGRCLYSGRQLDTECSAVYYEVRSPKASMGEHQIRARGR